jgi:hypothetical protein
VERNILASRGYRQEPWLSVRCRTDVARKSLIITGSWRADVNVRTCLRSHSRRCSVGTDLNDWCLAYIGVVVAQRALRVFDVTDQTQSSALL